MPDDKTANDTQYDDDGNVIPGTGPAEGDESEGGDESQASENNEGDQPAESPAEGDEGESGDAPEEGEEAEEGDAPAGGDQKPDTGEDTDEPEIPVREGHNAFQAKKRISAKKQKKASDGGEEEEGEGEGGEEGGDAAPADVSQEVAKQIGPIKENLAKRADEQELKDLFVAEPDSKAYEKRIRAYMKHPVYKGVPAKAIYAFLAFDNAKRIGAKQKANADAEADQTAGGGRQIRKKESKGSSEAPTSEAVAEMSEEDIQAKQDELMEQS